MLIHLLTTISFYSISSAAALVSWTFCAAKLAQPTRPGAKAPKTTGWGRVSFFSARHQATYGFGVMYLALTILLNVRLGEWDLNKEPGLCYHASYITTRYASHPVADQVYVSISAVWMLMVVGAASFLGPNWRKWILWTSFLQFPVHLYMAIALRSENQGKLAGEETDENDWDFGQTTAVLLLASALEELVRKGSDYLKFEKMVRSGADMDEDGAADEEQGTVLKDLVPERSSHDDQRMATARTQPFEERLGTADSGGHVSAVTALETHADEASEPPRGRRSGEQRP